MCRPCPIEGNATLTIVKSSTTMNWAMAKVTSRAVPLFGALGAVPPVPSDEGPLLPPVLDVRVSCVV